VRSARAIYVKELAKLWESYEKAMSEAQSHLQQFQTTMRACNLQNKATEILVGTLALFSPAGEAAALAEGADEAEAVKQTLGMLGSPIGDPGSTFFNVITKLTNNQDPTVKLLPNSFFQTYLSAATAAEKALAFINGSSVAQLEQLLQGCSGPIGLSYNTWKGANEYVSALKEAMATVPRTQTLVNDIRQLDTELPDLQYKDYAACVRRARCLDQPESSCASLKPAGNWPDVK